MATYFAPRSDIQDANGNPYPLARAYFYRTGTTTPKAVYANEALTIAHAHPVVADASGRWPAIWLATDEAYNIVITTAADVVIYSADPHRPAVLADTFNDLATSVRRIVSSPIDYGAVGDGVADDYDAVQAAIDNATGTVDLLGLTYKVDSQLIVPSNRRIINGTLDFSAVIGDMITLTGSLDAPIPAGDVSQTDTLDESVSIAGRDTLWLTSNYLANPDLPMGELVRIKTPGTNILMSDCYGTYLTIDSSQIQRLNPIHDVVFENINIRHTSGNTAVKAQYAIDLSFINCSLRSAGSFARLITCQNVKIQGCTFNNGGHRACIFEDSCQDIRVDGCYIENSAGFSIGNTLSEFGGSGVTRNVSITNCFMTGFDQVAHIGVSASYINISNNSFHHITSASSEYILTFGTRLTVSNNRIYGSNGPYFIVSAPKWDNTDKVYGEGDDYLYIHDNSVMDGTSTPYNDLVTTNRPVLLDLEVRPDMLDIRNVSICNNADFDDIAIYGNSSEAGTISHCNIVNNTLRGNLEVESLDGALVDIAHLTIANNHVVGTISVLRQPSSQGSVNVNNNFSVGIELVNPDTASISNNHIQSELQLRGEASGTSGYIRHVAIVGNIFPVNSTEDLISAIRLLGDDIVFKNVVIANNVIHRTGFDCIDVNISGASTLSNLLIQGNILTLDTGASGRGIDISISGTSVLSHGVITGNSVDHQMADGFGILVDTDDTAVVKSLVLGMNAVTLLDTAFGAALVITGAAASSIDTGSVVGNVLAEGTYGVSITNGVRLVYDGNAHRSHSIGAVNGTPDVTGDNAT